MTTVSMPTRGSPLLSARQALYLAGVGAGFYGFIETNSYAFQDPQSCLSKYGFLLLASASAVALLLPVTAPSPSVPTRSSRIVALTLLSLVIVAFIVKTGVHQFGGADQSTLIDAGWRLMQGQRLFADFVAPLPPAFALGSKWAFQICGLRWDAMVYLAAAYSVMLFIWTYALLIGLAVRHVTALAIAFASQAATQMVCAYWWYNPASDSAAVVWLLSALAFWQRMDTWRTVASLALATALVALMKPNAWPVVIAGVPILATSWRHMKPLAVVVAAAAILVIAVATVGHFSLADMFDTYRGVAATRGKLFTSKAFQDMGPYEHIAAYGLAVLLIAPAAVVLISAVLASQNRRHCFSVARPVAICLAGMVNGLMLLQTNMEFKCADLTVILIPASLIVYVYGPALLDSRFHHSIWSAQVPRFLILTMTVAFTIGPLVWGWQRVRVFGIGYQMFFEFNAEARTAVPPFFASMRMGRRLQVVLNQTDRLLKKVPNAKIMFGPRMQFGYAAFGRPSPTGVPIAWDSGTMYPASLEPELARRFEAEQFDILIFLKNDFTYIPLPVWQVMQKDFAAVSGPEIGELTVVVRK